MEYKRFVLHPRTSQRRSCNDPQQKEGTMLASSAVQELKSRFHGELILPSDQQYETARAVFNVAIDRRPALIGRCFTSADVVEAVNFSRRENLLLAVRGTGHNVAGFAVCDDGIVIDLSAMKGIRVDAAARSVRVEPGCNWGEVNDALQPQGLAATGGFVSVTGVSGLTLGGGLGWLVRKHGLALDNLLSAEIVTADGQLLIASASQNEDLFWGLCGGAAISASSPHSSSRCIPRGRCWPVWCCTRPRSARGPAVLARVRADSPKEFTDGALLFNAPVDMPQPDALRREPIVGIGGVYTGPLDAAE